MHDELFVGVFDERIQLGTPGFRVAFSNWRTTGSDVTWLCAVLAKNV